MNSFKYCSNFWGGGLWGGMAGEFHLMGAAISYCPFFVQACVQTSSKCTREKVPHLYISSAKGMHLWSDHAFARRRLFTHFLYWFHYFGKENEGSPFCERLS
jgi:hypothetical protein